MSSDRRLDFGTDPFGISGYPIEERNKIIEAMCQLDERRIPHLDPGTYQLDGNITVFVTPVDRGQRSVTIMLPDGRHVALRQLVTPGQRGIGITTGRVDIGKPMTEEEKQRMNTAYGLKLQPRDAVTRTEMMELGGVFGASAGHEEPSIGTVYRLNGKVLNWEGNHSIKPTGYQIYDHIARAAVLVPKHDDQSWQLIAGTESVEDRRLRRRARGR